MPLYEGRWFACRGFSSEDGTATIPLNVLVTGDVTIVASHARSTFGGKVQGKVREGEAGGGGGSRL